MFYYLFDYLHQEFSFPGAGVFQYISFRAAMALLTSLIISLVYGKRIINYLLKKQVGESIRDLGLEGQSQKAGTPTMGGLIIISAILIPTLLFAKLNNVYVILMVVSTIWLGVIGFIDDYIKVFKHNKQGLAGKFKILGQIGLGIIVGTTMYFNDSVVIKEKLPVEQNLVNTHNVFKVESYSVTPELFSKESVKSTKTTLPFFKNHEFDYSSLLSFLGKGYKKWAFLIFIPIVIFIITAVSNGANITDGLDGLATGIGVIGSFIIFGVSLFWDVAQSGTSVIALALAGALFGFLIWNWHPAKIFLGEAGSTFIGFSLGVLALISGGKIATALLIMGIPILDVVWVIMRRTIMERKSMAQADRKHLHHRLLDIGFSHPRAVIFLYFVTGIFGLSSIFQGTQGKIKTLLFMIFFMLILAYYLVWKYKKSTNERTNSEKL